MPSKQNAKLLKKGEYTELSLRTKPDGIQFVRKSAFYPGSEKLANEAMFIMDSLPQTARGYFPEVIGYKTNFKATDGYYYDMPYYQGQMLREKIVTDADDSSEVAKDVENALRVLKESLYSAESFVAPKQFVQDHYIDRVKSRLLRYERPEKSSLESTPINQLSEVQMHDFFTNLVHRSRVVVNGKEVLTPLEILKELETKVELEKLILPPSESMRLIHGDPHLGNIMVRNQGSKPLFFDPNGFHTGGDIAYDLGKFILSLDYLDLLLEDEVIYPSISWSHGKIEVGNLQSFKMPQKAKKLQHSLEIVLTEVLPRIFADKLAHDPLLIERSIFVASLHAFACAHTFIPTIHKNTAIPLLLHFMQRANAHLEKPTRSSNYA